MHDYDRMNIFNICIRDNRNSKIVAPLTDGRHMGLMVSLRGTLSLRRNRAMSLSKLRKLKSPVSTLTTYLVSAPFSVHLSCSPNVTLIMNHMNLKTGLGKLIMLLWRT